MPFVPAVVPPARPDPDSLWFLFEGDRLLVGCRGDAISILRRSEVEKGRLRPARTHYLGAQDGVPCYTGELTDPVAPEGTVFRPLRPLVGTLPEELFTLAGRAFQVMDWDRTSRFCGKCGATTRPLDRERAKVCTECGLSSYPRVTPAVIVSVVRGREILLAHARRFPSAFYSVLAGFVEPGETFEECVHREVREETGIEVANLRYAGSQPWPFPHSLMVAFTAEYAGGTLIVEEGEIVHAAWYGPEEVPRLAIPRRGTIARQLIDRFLAESTAAKR